jgi:hypothetical protein
VGSEGDGRRSLERKKKKTYGEWKISALIPKQDAG